MASTAEPWYRLAVRLSQRHILGAKPIQLAYGLALLSLVAVLRPILNSHWLGDDWPNSQTGAWNRWRYGTNSLSRVIQTALNANTAWMSGQGRFFPSAILEANLVFNYLSLEEYKALQFLLAVASLLSCVLLVFLLSRSHTTTLMFSLALAVSIQFRRDFDPHLGFTALVPSTVLKLSLASITLYSAACTRRLRSHTLLGLLGSALYFGAMSTYEHAFVLVVVPLGSILVGYFHSRHRKKALSAVVFLLTPWLLYFWIVFLYLPSRIGEIQKIPRYILGVESNSIWVLLSQLFAPLPLIVFRSSRDLSGNSDSILALVVAIFTFICGFSLIGRLLISQKSHRDSLRVQRSTNAVLAIIGTSLIVLPSLLLALRPGSFEASRFTKFQPDLTYLHIFISQIGMALLLSLIVTPILRFVVARRKTQLLRLTALCYAVVLFLTVSHNYAVAQETRNRELNYESWLALHRDGSLFVEMKSGDSAISQSANFAYETNPGAFYVESGIRLTSIHPLSYLFTVEELECKENATCELPDIRQRIARELTNMLTFDSKRPFSIGADKVPTEGDFVWRSLRPEAIATSRLWIFDLYPVTSRSFIAFTAPLLSDQLELNSGDLLLVKTEVIEEGFDRENLKPSLGGVCLTEKSELRKVSGPGGYPLVMTFWKFPEPARKLNYLTLDFGVC